jgi:hypothetical protein
VEHLSVVEESLLALFVFLVRFESFENEPLLAESLLRPL